MKIKEVCEKTGLTDKAVRTYIREGLITPNYEENYRGRKSFDFSNDDIEQLKRIVVLRKYNFSLKEISSLFNNEIEANELLNKHITEMKSDVNSDINVINSMVNVYNESPASKFDLCDMLDNPVIADKPIPLYDNQSVVRNLYLTNLKQRKQLRIIITVLTVIAIVLTGTIVTTLFTIKIDNTNTDDFAGLCVITTNESVNLHDKNYDILELSDNLLMLDDIENPTKLIDVNSKFSKVDYTFSREGKLSINAKINVNEKWVIIVPIYKDDNGDYYGANQNAWANVENTDFFTYDSLKCKANNIIFRYKISVKSDYSKFFGDEA